MGLRDKICVVTGGGRGIGKATAILFSKRGANVGVADIDEKTASNTVAEIRAMGRESIAVKMDVSDPQSVNNAMDSISKQFDRIDVWVNNAGTGSRARLEDMTVEQWDRVLDINLKGTFLCTQAAARIMKKQKSGRIINISSRAGKGGSYGHINYSSSKAGVIGLTKSAARELGEYNITVNAILPGFIETELTNHLSEEIKKKLTSEIVLGRLGRPEDVAKAVAFLASDEAEWITGACLEVTGGSGMFAG